MTETSIAVLAVVVIFAVLQWRAMDTLKTMFDPRSLQKERDAFLKIIERREERHLSPDKLRTQDLHSIERREEIKQGGTTDRKSMEQVIKHKKYPPVSNEVPLWTNEGDEYQVINE